MREMFSRAHKGGGIEDAAAVKHSMQARRTHISDGCAAIGLGSNDGARVPHWHTRGDASWVPRCGQLNEHTF